MKFLKNVPKVIKYILLLLAAFVLAVSTYISTCYDVGSFEQLLYTVRNAEGTGMDSIKGGIIISITSTVFVFIILLLPIAFSRLKTKIFLQIQVKKKKCEFPISYFSHKFLYCFVIFIVSVLVALNNLDFYDYISRQLHVSTIYEEQYVDPNSVTLTFPEKKQNLIYIFVESLEMSSVSWANGGNQYVSYIPKLEQMALENTSFSNRDTLGGAVPINGTDWTAAGMIAQMMGINMKVNINGNDYSGYSSFLGGATGIGDILKKNGYNNYFLMGSEAKFGGRDEMLKQHGNYEVYDLDAARNDGKLPKDYKVWWGYEDSKLFEYAKEKATEAYKAGKPFNVSMLTANTHFWDGYLEKDCPTIYDEQYANVFYCADKMVAEFVDWVKEQPFGEDTTIVIAGDHPTMQYTFYDVSTGYTRTVYNVFINSKVEASKIKNRDTTTMDYFPTTLAAMGVKIEGDRLGLGTNLFSDKPTLLEEMGWEKFNAELARRSIFYDEKLLGDSYYEIQKTVQEEAKKASED